MGVVYLQKGKPICFLSETFSKTIINYPTYDKELFSLVESVKKWKHYLMGKETMIHTNHYPLQYLQSQTKLQQYRHYRWIGFLQQFHLVIKYKKGVTNKVDDMLSRPSLNASVVLQNSSLKHESYLEQYSTGVDFKDIYESLTHGTQVEEINFHVHERVVVSSG